VIQRKWEIYVELVVRVIMNKKNKICLLVQRMQIKRVLPWLVRMFNLLFLIFMVGNGR
jgi:hypothetical protein